MRANGPDWTLGWTLRLAIAGFAMCSLCASVTRVGRNALVAAYLVIVAVLLLAYIRSSAVHLAGYLTQRWRTWLGMIYGIVDGLLLNVMPVWIVYSGQAQDIDSRGSGAWHGDHGPATAPLLTLLPWAVPLLNAGVECRRLTPPADSHHRSSRSIHRRPGGPGDCR
jgi:hypothetical protein